MPTTDSDGVDIHFTVHGRGEPLLLIAGTGYSGATWSPALLHFLSRHWAVITFDHRGTGTSSTSSEDFTTQMFARDAAAVIEAVGLGAAHAIGHSMGGRVAQHLYLQSPHLVQSLILLASGAGADTEPDLRRVGIPPHAVLAIVEDGYLPYIHAKHRSNFFTTEFTVAQPEQVLWLDAAYDEGAPSLPDYLKHVRARQAHSTVQAAPSIECPVMIVVGEADVNDGGTGSHVAEAHRLHELVPGSRFEVVPRAKHGFPWESVEATVALIDDFVRHLATAVHP